MTINEDTIELERQLAELESSHATASAKRDDALAAYKSNPTDAAKKRVLAARDDIELASLARDGGRERLDAARAAHAEAAREAARLELEERLAATGIESFRKHVAPHVKELAALEQRKAELGALVETAIIAFESERKGSLAFALERDIAVPAMLDYRALVAHDTARASGKASTPADPAFVRKNFELVEALCSGPKLVRARAVLAQLKDAEQRLANLEQRAAANPLNAPTRQLAECKQEIDGARAELEQLGASRLAARLGAATPERTQRGCFPGVGVMFLGGSHAGQG